MTGNFRGIPTRLAAALCVAILWIAAPLAAQGLFAPVARVNDQIITQFEVDQRARFLQLLNAPGATQEAALEALIGDRLRNQAIQAAGLQVTEEGLTRGLAEFAGRANLTTEEFVTALEAQGVAAETFRDFVSISLAWRDLIRARYGARVQIGEAEIDRALAATGTTGGIRVLLSEIIIPAPPPQREQVQSLAEQIAQSQSEAEFSGFARRYSATNSRQAGGRLPWTPINNLPPALRGILLSLDIGEVSDPLPLQNAVALFQLRGIEETDAPTRDYAAIEYAAYYIDGGRSDAALAFAERLKARVDVCDDLYGVAQGQPEQVLDRGSLPPADIPEDIAIELAKLDPGEVSTALTRAEGQTLVFLMLCGRTPALEEDQEIDREAIATRLRNERLTAFADSLLDELRADATITLLTGQ